MMEVIRMTPGPGFSLRHLLLYYVNRLVPLYSIRRVIAYAVARRIGTRRRGAPLSDVLAPAVDQLRERGCARLAPLFTAAQLEDILEHLRRSEVVADGLVASSSAASQKTRIASYSLRTILTCPHILAAINSDAILDLGERYLGCRPTISGVRIDKSFPTVDERPEYVQCFHRDYDDWRFFKLFVYLSDVDEHNGPHEFVARSHVKSGRILATPYTVDDIRRVYGPDSVEQVTGLRGTTFLVDTWGIHRGAVPQRRERMLLQVQYSLLPVYKFRYRPLTDAQVHQQQLDRYTNRLLIKPIDAPRR
jgi:hypothetical protein